MRKVSSEASALTTLKQNKRRLRSCALRLLAKEKVIEEVKGGDAEGKCNPLMVNWEYCTAGRERKHNKT